MRQRLLLLGLVLFVAMDVFLVSLAVQHTRGPAPAAGPTGGAASSTDPAGPGTASTSPSPGAEPSPSAPAASQPVRFLSVSDDGAVLRATRGGCDGAAPATVEFAAGSDSEPEPQDVPDLAEVLSTEAVSGQDLMVIGLDDRCRAGRYTSSDGGSSWSRKGGDGPTWHLGPDPEADSVTSPGGPRSTPCLPSALSTLDQSVVRLLCDDGQVLGSDDGGTSWVALGRLAGAVDIRFLSTGEGYALASQPDCPSAVMRTSDGGTTWEQLVCLPGRRPRAVAARGALVAAQVGRRTFVSTDGGQTWPGAGG